MKKLLLGLGVLLMGTTAFAQNTNGSTARFGIKGGVNIATYSGKGFYDRDWKSNVGYTVTGYGEFGLGSNFLLQPGISLQNKGAKLEETSVIGNGSATAKYRQNVMALEIPINVAYNIPTGNAGAVQVSAGPYVGFNLSGKEKYSGNVQTPVFAGQTNSNRDTKFGSNNTDDLSSTDFGLNFGLAFRHTSGFTVGANYGLGLTNLVPKDLRDNDNNKLKNRVVGITVGYSF